MIDLYKDKKVLVVDDTAFMRATLFKILIDLGFSKDNIYQAENGTLALEILTSSIKSDPKIEFDIVLSDWNMPSMTGIGLLKAVRSSSLYFKTIPLLLITTVSEKEKVIEAIQFHVSGYLIKPVQQPKLLEYLERIFNPEDIHNE